MITIDKNYIGVRCLYLYSYYRYVGFEMIVYIKSKKKNTMNLKLHQVVKERLFSFLTSELRTLFGFFNIDLSLISQDNIYIKSFIFFFIVLLPSDLPDFKKSKSPQNKHLTFEKNNKLSHHKLELSTIHLLPV